MRTIIDMAGRTVNLPNKILRIYAPSPYASTILYSLCPEKVCGHFLPIEDFQKSLLPECLLKLPVIGKITETDAIKMANPDIIIIWGDTKSPIHEKSEIACKNLGIPHIYACAGDLVDLRDYPAVYRFLGEILGIEERAERLAVYCEETLNETAEVVNNIHPQKRPRVYYAEGSDGQQTEFSNSLHAHLLQLVGDVNIHRGILSGHAGMEKLTSQQILDYNPEIIIIWMEEAKNAILNPNSFWAHTSAVKNNKVFMIPKHPFSYFDRPPCFMRILGLKWLLSICYPEYYKKDLERETADFLNIFLNVK